jgi:hypothetical protein
VKGVRELEQMLAAERAEQRLPEAAERGLAGLRDALAAGVPALDVAHGPLALGGSALAKWLASVGLIAIGVAGSGLLMFPAPAARPAQSAAVPAARPAAPAASREPVLASPEPAAVSTLDADRASPPREVARAGAAPAVSATSTPSSAAASTFAEEFRLMKAAKQALDAGKLHLVQVWLDEHARLHPQGVFQSERQALEVLLACRRAPQSGSAAARRYVNQQPSSPFVDRIARACQLEGAPAPTPSAANFPDGGK